MNSSKVQAGGVPFSFLFFSGQHYTKATFTFLCPPIMWFVTYESWSPPALLSLPHPPPTPVIHNPMPSDLIYNKPNIRYAFYFFLLFFFLGISSTEFVSNVRSLFVCLLYDWGDAYIYPTSVKQEKKVRQLQQGGGQSSWVIFLFTR